MKLEWKESYNFGIPSIDEQHQRLLQMINALSDIQPSDNLVEVCTQAISDMADYVAYHFSYEEKFFDEFQYEHSEEHKMEHVKFINKVATLKQEVSEVSEDNALELIYSILDYLQDWLIVHIMGTDRQYVETFKEHGLK